MIRFLLFTVSFILCSLNSFVWGDGIKGYSTIEPWISYDYYAESPKFWSLFVGSSSTTDDAKVYYKIISDSTVNGKNYALVCFEVKPLSYLNGGTYEIVPYYEPAFSDSLLYRQDGNQVFCLSKDGKQEFLILDYGLEEGDSFVTPMGQILHVKETGYFNEYKDHILSSDQEPKMLRLVSEDEESEDVWVEGIGSLQWGILPLYMAMTIEPFRNSPSNPLKMHVIESWGKNLFAEFCVFEDTYKSITYHEPKDESAGEEMALTYSFAGNTLLVRGYYPLNLYPTSIEAHITGNNVDIMISQTTTQDIVKGKHMALIDARIPGFKAGQYTIGFKDSEHVAIECRTTAIRNLFDPQPANRQIPNKAIYELSGRPLSAPPDKGFFIQDGQKVVR